MEMIMVLKNWKPFIRNREIPHTRTLWILLSLFALSGCNVEDGVSLLFEKESRLLAGKTELTPQGVTIDIQPPLEVKNTVQYIALAIEDANQWRTGSAPNDLLNNEGKVFRIGVQLQAENGQHYILDSVSFGRDLLFSYLDPNTPPGESDLPKFERFTKLLLRSNEPITVQEVRWFDITNK